MTCGGARLGHTRLRPYCVVVEAVLARGSAVVPSSKKKNGVLLLIKRWQRPGLAAAFVAACIIHRSGYSLRTPSQPFYKSLCARHMLHFGSWAYALPNTKNKTGLSFARCCFKLSAAVQGARLVEDMQGGASGGMEPLPASVREWATAAALTHMRFGTNLETQQHLGPARPGPSPLM